MLQQEGIPFTRVDLPAPFAFRAGRFVIHDTRSCPGRELRPLLSQDHRSIDINPLRALTRTDPFRDWLETRSARLRWRIDGLVVRERACRVDKAAIRTRILGWLRSRVLSQGGLWAHLASFPYPFRAAFNLRVDLDEAIPDDYHRFACLRLPLDNCTTHFVSTAAYAGNPSVMTDLRGRDTQSHAHHHHVSRDESRNRANLERAHQALRRWGIEPCGFAAPGGRWNHGLDNLLEELGYLYSSDFQVAYDDLPSFPWKHDRFSRVLQVPIHPVCEGIFLEAGDRDGRRAARHLAQVVATKIVHGEPAFVYGHPERRLAHCPEIFEAILQALAAAPLVWRTTLTEFARWWTWRIDQRFSLVPLSRSSCSVRFESRADRYPLALVIDHGSHTASVPVSGPRTIIHLDRLLLERRRLRHDLPAPQRDWHLPGPRHWLRSALDWETVTPLDELPVTTLRARCKKALRAWKEQGGASQRGAT
jgi:peptidoglycan/xylan/chitin deacetylase (PgdA/CDA1 family)